MANTFTVKAVIEMASDYLKRHKTEEPQMETELLMSRLLNCRRLELALHYERILEEKFVEAMRRGIKRVANGEPVQYVIGEVDFMGCPIKIDKRALIPRPETEELVDWILNHNSIWNSRKKGETPPVVVDVGTGCGCIVFALATKRPNTLYAAIDISSESLSLAQENAVRLGLADKVALLHGELADVVDEETLDIVVSNPPYVRTADYEALPPKIKNYEPRIALDGGEDGMDVIKIIIQDSAIALKNGGHLFMEIGYDQADAVKLLLEENEFTGIEIKKDLAGHNRMIHAEKP